MQTVFTYWNTYTATYWNELEYIITNVDRVYLLKYTGTSENKKSKFPSVIVQWTIRTGNPSSGRTVRDLVVAADGREDLAQALGLQVRLVHTMKHYVHHLVEKNNKHNLIILVSLLRSSCTVI